MILPRVGSGREYAGAGEGPGPEPAGQGPEPAGQGPVVSAAAGPAGRGEA